MEGEPFPRPASTGGYRSTNHLSSMVEDPTLDSEEVLALPTVMGSTSPAASHANHQEAMRFLARSDTADNNSAERHADPWSSPDVSAVHTLGPSAAPPPPTTTSFLPVGSPAVAAAKPKPATPIPAMKPMTTTGGAMMATASSAQNTPSRGPGVAVGGGSPPFLVTSTYTTPPGAGRSVSPPLSSGGAPPMITTTMSSSTSGPSSAPSPPRGMASNAAVQPPSTYHHHRQNSLVSSHQGSSNHMHPNGGYQGRHRATTPTPMPTSSFSQSEYGQQQQQLLPHAHRARSSSPGSVFMVNTNSGGRLMNIRASASHNTSSNNYNNNNNSSHTVPPTHSIGAAASNNNNNNSSSAVSAAANNSASLPDGFAPFSSYASHPGGGAAGGGTAPTMGGNRSATQYRPEWLTAAQRVRTTESLSARSNGVNVLPAEQNANYGLRRYHHGLTEAQLRATERSSPLNNGGGGGMGDPPPFFYGNGGGGSVHHTSSGGSRSYASHQPQALSSRLPSQLTAQEEAMVARENYLMTDATRRSPAMGMSSGGSNVAFTTTTTTTTAPREDVVAEAKRTTVTARDVIQTLGRHACMDLAADVMCCYCALGRFSEAKEFASVVLARFSFKRQSPHHPLSLERPLRLALLHASIAAGEAEDGYRVGLRLLQDSCGEEECEEVLELLFSMQQRCEDRAAVLQRYVNEGHDEPPLLVLLGSRYLQTRSYRISLNLHLAAHTQRSSNIYLFFAIGVIYLFCSHQKMVREQEACVTAGLYYLGEYQRRMLLLSPMKRRGEVLFNLARALQYLRQPSRALPLYERIVYELRVPDECSREIRRAARFNISFIYRWTSMNTPLALATLEA